MESTPLTFSVLGLLLVFAGWATYLATIPRGRVPVRPWGTMAVELGGMLLGLVGIAGSLRGEASVGLAVALGVPTLTLGSLFFFLLSRRKTPLGAITVREGDQLLPFRTFDSDGNVFDTASLAGQRVLLKFFRGHW